MSEKTKRASVENVTKGNSGDKQEQGLHPIKGTVKDNHYKDEDASKNRLEGLDKEELENQIQTATEASDKRVSDKIQNSENK
ncbi:hypothetical protein [Polaribacter septentrionalilitoris]|uniref:hypothetical protein n=1 Tax=Polaribacter septentrionalilitoris TaxID=2494657 RepID=UPI001359A221|nr:hypothetical protein [Polaribacter septentrionalilitoris]